MIEQFLAYGWWVGALCIVLGFVALVKGADFLVDGASAIAKRFGISDLVIGLTVVAVGTSLPELFASVMAARKGETDMAVGNIIGSVSFNILSVVGVASAITPIQNAWGPFAIDYMVMIGLGVLLWLFLRTHRKIVRYEGAILLIIYCLYIAKTLMM